MLKMVLNPMGLNTTLLYHCFNILRTIKFNILSIWDEYHDRFARFGREFYEIPIKKQITWFVHQNICKKLRQNHESAIPLTSFWLITDHSDLCFKGLKLNGNRCLAMINLNNWSIKI